MPKKHYNQRLNRFDKHTLNIEYEQKHTPPTNKKIQLKKKNHETPTK